MRLIDADVLIALINKRLKNSVIIGWLCSIIGEVPTIEARPVVRGEWIEKPHTDGFGGHYFLYHCSRCDTPYAKKRNFCNECGADMRGEDDEAD